MDALPEEPLLAPREEAAAQNEEEKMETVEDVDSDDDEQEEEDECRICRGPAEEGRPLLMPCKCSGSMGLTHQDCLTSWLEVTRGDGRCEICKTKFRFDPQYAENTPNRLPPQEVVLGLSSRFLARWLPLAIRICIAVFLWLIVAPLLTNSLYHGWMIRPSSVPSRWKRELILADIVSGAVLTAIIIISFLSLMSFADFLRAHWQQPPRDRQDQQQPGGQRRAEDGENDADPVLVVEDGVINFLDRQAESAARVSDESGYSDSNEGAHTALQEDNTQQASTAHQYAEQAQRIREAVLGREANRQNTELGGDGAPVPVVDEDNEEPQEVPDRNVQDDLEDDFQELDEVEDGWLGDDGELQDDAPDDEGGENARDDDNVGNPRPRDGEVPAPLPNLDAIDPMLQDDQVDMEINVALDELLGLRGPISALIRNLLWLLAFNATYLGIFGFFPKTLGLVAYSGILNTTFCSNLVTAIPFVNSTDENRTTVMSILSALEQESIERNTTFKLSELATVTLGYLFIACMIVTARYALVVFQKFQRVGNRLRRTPSQRAANRERRHQRWQNPGPERNDQNDRNAVDGDDIGTYVVSALDSTVAIVKVGLLLFLKMFLLPLFLGFCLDVSTVHLFGHDLARRLAFAGSDLFSFILLHWVAGITFMLLVTVFLLQLREVTHPDILARVIRPQEPQPDLLGNLLHETVLTHMKRMLLSLVIYAPLLSLHIFFPIKLFLSSGLEQSISFFRLNFYHLLMPQLQIPLELITFHLSMLALLERYKNSIGKAQHRWMKFMCRTLGLTEYMLPRNIDGFEYVGSKQVFLPRDNDEPFKIDPFLMKLANTTDAIEDNFILSNVGKAGAANDPPQGMIEGKTGPRGERVVYDGFTHIKLPGEDQDEILLPTITGRFRLHLREEQAVEFFREVPGEEISRPPEGWDDLGAGGAYVQGRYAWGKERKSKIECGVAQRTPFRQSSKQGWPVGLALRVLLVLVLSWFAVTCTAVAMLSAPLAVGRSFYYILRIPEKYIHDPFAFCIGAGLFFPLASMLSRSINRADESLLARAGKWMARFRRPPAQKVLVLLQSFILWFVIAPATFGISYEVAIVKSQQWFAGEEELVDAKSLAFLWFMGTVVLNTWSFLLYFRCFTKQFWANIGNGILEPPPEENANANAARRAREAINANQDEGQGVGPQNISWQGNQGRVAGFYRIWRSVLKDWDWETVDRTKLIDDFARPVTKQLASALVGSSLSFHLLLLVVLALFPVVQGQISFPLIGPISIGLFRMSVFRLCMLSHVLVQLASAFRGSIDGWFEAAHEAARDDRYLVGEVLLNYQRPEAVDSAQN